MSNRSENGGQQQQEEEAPHLLRIDVRKAPPPPPATFFQCPISLEVMRSPVSLCTGVTYDRSSIQRWLDCGNTTCPATMQSLPSTDLIPNLTLGRLIHRWSPPPSRNLPTLSDLPRALSDASADESSKLRLLSSDALRPSALAALFHAPETRELAVNLLSIILSLDPIYADHKRALIRSLLSDLDATFSSLLSILRGAAHLPSRISAAIVLESILSPASSNSIDPDLITEMVRLIREIDPQAVDAGLRCVIALIEHDPSISTSSPASGKRLIREKMVSAGIVNALVNVISKHGDEIPADVAERGIRVMEAVAGCGDGREAICVEAGICLPAVMGRMMKIGKEGREAAVSLLWNLCCAGGGDLRAREAAAETSGGLAKMLVVLQGICSPAARKMAGDLLRVFRVNASTADLLVAAGYDSKTMHIMPF